MLTEGLVVARVDMLWAERLQALRSYAVQVTEGMNGTLGARERGRQRGGHCLLQ